MIRAYFAVLTLLLFVGATPAHALDQYDPVTGLEAIITGSININSNAEPTMSPDVHLLDTGYQHSLGERSSTDQWLFTMDADAEAGFDMGNSRVEDIWLTTGGPAIRAPLPLNPAVFHMGYQHLESQFGILEDGGTFSGPVDVKTAVQVGKNPDSRVLVLFQPLVYVLGKSTIRGSDTGGVLHTIAGLGYETKTGELEETVSAKADIANNFNGGHYNEYTAEGNVSNLFGVPHLGLDLKVIYLDADGRDGSIENTQVRGAAQTAW